MEQRGERRGEKRRDEVGGKRWRRGLESKKGQDRLLIVVEERGHMVKRRGEWRGEEMWPMREV